MPTSAPSRSKCQPWYEHMKRCALPISARHTLLPRWGQVFSSTRTAPSRPRTAITSSSPIQFVKKSPGSGTWDSWQTKFHARAKMRSSSSR